MLGIKQDPALDSYRPRCGAPVALPSSGAGCTLDSYRPRCGAPVALPSSGAGCMIASVMWSTSLQ